MQFKNILAFLAAASAVQATVDVEVERSLNSTELDERDDFALEERFACVRGVHVVAAGGEGTTKGDLGYLQSLVDNIKAAIPGSNAHQIPYPPGADPGTSIGYAWPRMKKHVRAYAKQCPKAKIVLVGYSVGGAVVMDTICGEPEGGTGGLPRRYAKHIVATIAYGDPTFVANKDYDKGTCDGSQGPSDVPRAKPGKCFPFGKHVRSYCDYNDPECCNGGDVNVHFAYPSRYDGIATNYVKRRWQASKGK